MNDQYFTPTAQSNRHDQFENESLPDRVGRVGENKPWNEFEYDVLRHDAKMMQCSNVSFPAPSKMHFTCKMKLYFA